jgi:hypothetical protein
MTIVRIEIQARKEGTVWLSTLRIVELPRVPMR